MSERQHVDILGAIYAILGGLFLFVAVFLVAVVGFRAVASGDARDVMDTMTSDPRMMASLLSLLPGLPAFIGGIGLLKRKSWAWGLVWVLACMGLVSFPIGMALGAYAIWVLTRSETRQALRVDANGSTMMRTVKVTAVLSLLLMIASYPACQLSEPIMQAELNKLSPEERELRQFDLVYVRWGLPGILAFLWGLMLGVVAFISWIVERIRIRKSVRHAPVNSNVGNTAV